MKGIALRLSAVLLALCTVSLTPLQALGAEVKEKQVQDEIASDGTTTTAYTYDSVTGSAVLVFEGEFEY